MTALPGVVPYPPEYLARYRAAGYWRGETLGGLLRGWARRWGGRTALVADGQRLTFAEVDEHVDRLAAGLLDLGLEPGDRVTMHLPNLPEFLIVAFACFRAAALPVFCLPAHREHELTALCGFSGAVAHVTATSERDFDFQGLGAVLRRRVAHLEHVLVAGDPADVSDGLTPLADLADDNRPRADIPARLVDCAPDPDDVAFFLLSGGTTGLPKLIPRTHDDYAYNVRGSAEIARLTADDTYLAALPIGHNFPFGCFGALGTWSVGGTVVLARDPNPSAAFQLIADERVTCTALVPALALRWLDAAADRNPHDLASLRLLQVGGSRFNTEPARRVARVLGCTLQQVFGMAEGLLNYTRLDDPDEVLIHTQGRPMSPADELHIVDETGEPVADGEPGELLTRGPYTIRGYFQAPEHNARSFTADGFYRTGDIVRRHESGNLVVEGRAKDIINRGGENISAEEVEDLALSHPAVANAAAVAMPDPELGERVCLYVVLRHGATLTLDELRGHLRRRKVASHTYPERLEITAELPMTTVGKISKQDLRDDIVAKLGHGT